MIKLIKSYKFWTALAGSLGVLLMALSDTLNIKINVDGVKECIMALCSVLVVFGIVKKPNKNNNKNSIELNQTSVEIENNTENNNKK